MSITTKLRSMVDDVVHTILCTGRLHYIDLRHGQHILRIVNVHLQETNNITKLMIIDMLKELLNIQIDGIVVVLGDFNASVSGEGRYSQNKGMKHCSNEKLSKLVDECMGSHTEMFQEAFTHRTVRQ